ncbi:hypothetical protein BH11PLA2_BH11PLA2_44260 [soil metagenome]
MIKDITMRANGPLILPEFLPPGLSARPSSEPPLTTGVDLAVTIESLLKENTKGLYGRVISIAERELITRVLRHTHGHQGQACDLLGIDRKTLRNKLRDLGVMLDKVVIEGNDAET